MTETLYQSVHRDEHAGTLDNHFIYVEQMIRDHTLSPDADFSHAMFMREFWGGNIGREIEAQKIVDNLAVVDLAINSPTYFLRGINAYRDLIHGGSIGGLVEGSKALSKHSKLIQEGLGKAIDFDTKFAYFDALLSLAGFNDDSEAWHALKNNSAIVKQGIKADDPDRWSWMISRALYYEDPQTDKAFASQVIKDIFELHKKGEVSDEAVVTMLSKIADGRGPNDSLFKTAVTIVQYFLTQYGIKMDDVFVSKWISRYGKGHSEKEPFYVHVKKELESIMNLEKQRPGIVNGLFRNFGIRHFSRYSPQMLIEQFDNIDTQAPWVIVVSADDDWNQGHARRNIELWNELKEQLGDDYLIRFTAAADALEFAKVAHILKKKYGGTKASFAHFVTHGNRGRFSLGAPSIQRGELASRNLEIFSTLLEKDAEIIWDACLTGSKKKGIEGIAQTVSDKIGRTVFASTAEVFQTDMWLDTDVHPPKVDVMFNGSRRSVRKFEPSQKAV